MKCWATSLLLDTSMQSNLHSKGIFWRRELVCAWNCSLYNVLKLSVLKFFRIYNSCQIQPTLNVPLFSWSCFMVCYFLKLSKFFTFEVLCVCLQHRRQGNEFILNHQFFLCFELRHQLTNNLREYLLNTSSRK